MSDPAVTLRVRGDGSSAIKSSEDVKKSLAGIGDAGKKAGSEATHGLDRAGKSTELLGKQAQLTTDYVRRLVAGFLTIQTVRSLISLADQAKMLDAQMRLATKSTAEFAIAQQETLAIATRNGAALESTVNLYSRMSRALADTDASQRELLGITETIAQAFRVSGADAASAAGAITQLSQAFASGTLRGDEFNSVNEAAPRLMEAMAGALGVTRGELRKLAEQGKLTADVMRTAFTGEQAAKIAAEAEQIPLTVSAAFVNLQSHLIRYVGDMDNATGATADLASAIDALGRNIKPVADALITMAQIAVVWHGSRLVLALGATTAAVYTKTAAVTAAAAQWKALEIATVGATSASARGLLTMTNLANGLVAAFAGWQIGKWLRENFLEAELAGIAFVEGVLTAWERMKEMAQVIWAHMKHAAISSIHAIRSALADMLEGYASVMQRDLFTGEAVEDSWAIDLANSIRPATDATAALSEEIRQIKDASGTAIADIRNITGAMVDDASAKRDATVATTSLTEAVMRASEANEVDAETLAERKRAMEELLQIQASLAEQAGRMAAEEQGDEAVAQFEYEQIVARVREQLDEAAEAAKRAAGGQDVLNKAHADGARVIALAANALARKNAQLEEEKDLVGRVARDYAEQIKMLGMTRREFVIYETVAELAANAQDLFNRGLRETADLLPDEVDAVQGMAGSLYDTTEAANALEEILSRFDGIGFGGLTSEIAQVKAALEEATDPAIIERLQRALGGLRQQGLESMVGASQQVLRSMQSMAKEGSSAYKAMEVASQALNVVLAIGAILNQGKGNPYTAFARMAAMAVAVAGLVGSIAANFGGGWTDTAAQRQETQGTGTVLGDADAKSESISRAIEITADATTALVGINRGMLRALITLQNSIGNATNMLARGAGDVEFSDLPRVDGGLLGGLFGGSSRITDQGLRIGGGSLSDIDLSAYQETQSRKWRFGSRRTRTEFRDVDDEFETQFQLIIDSIVGTVREGALALGLLPEEIEAALESFHIAEINISLMDLTAEEQQAELEAVFSQIFDNLAGHVVPFIAQFQQVGEGLGETLVRVATSVQVVQESMRYLGLTIDETDPERFAQISVALIELSGGIEEFVTGMMAFADAFAPESFRFESAQSALSDAFGQFGLAIPPTREAMWELMQSLDATTEEGREQIAILIQLTEAADAYYTALERGGESMIDQMTDLSAIMGIVDQALTRAAGGAVVDWQQAMGDLEVANQRLIDVAIEAGAGEEELARIREFGRLRVEELAAAEAAAAQEYADFIAEFDESSIFDSQIRQIQRQEREAIQRAHQLARAAGMQGAAERDLARIHGWAAREVAAAIEALRERTLDLIGQLYGSQGGGIGDAANDWTSGAIDGINQVAQAQRQLYQEQLAAIQQIQDYLISMQFGDLSALSPMQQLEAARTQLEVLQMAAMAGDADAMAALPQAAQQYLQLLQGAYASGEEFGAGYEWVQELLQAVVNQGPTVDDPGAVEGPTTPVYGGPVTVQPGDQWGAMNEIERVLLAQQLADHLGDLAAALNVPVLQLMTDMGVPLRQLAEDLGADLNNLTGESVRIIGEMALALGVPLGELVDALGLELPDLAAGIRELAMQLGIDLTSLTGTTAYQLAELARLLGANLYELQTSLGIDLGRLTDVNSPIYQALTQEIGTLPNDQAEALRTYLEAITAATTEADASAATEAMEGYIQTLDADIANQLAPYFEGVFPADAMSDLDYLSSIRGDTAAMFGELVSANGLLSRIQQNLSAQNVSAGIQAYAAGGWVNGPTTILAGEAGRELVLPNPVSEFLARVGIPVNVSGDGGVDQAELRAIRAELAEIKGSIREADRNNVEATREGSPRDRDALRDVLRETTVVRSVF